MHVRGCIDHNAYTEVRSPMGEPQMHIPMCQLTRRLTGEKQERYSQCGHSGKSTEAGPVTLSPPSRSWHELYIYVEEELGQWLEAQVNKWSWSIGPTVIFSAQGFQYALRSTTTGKVTHPVPTRQNLTILDNPCWKYLLCKLPCSRVDPVPCLQKVLTDLEVFCYSWNLRWLQRTD